MQLTVGSFVIIKIPDGDLINNYIAEVTQEEPQQLKVLDGGPYASLRGCDYILEETLTERFQDPEQQTALLKEEVERGYPLVSGLASLGVTDGIIRNVLPPDEPEPAKAP